MGENDSPVVLTPEASSSIRDIDMSSNIPLSVIAQTEDIPQNTSSNITTKTNETVDKPILEKETLNNVMGDKTEDIPSFSEWTQKRLEEAEKIQQINSSKNINGEFIFNLCLQYKLLYSIGILFFFIFF